MVQTTRPLEPMRPAPLLLTKLHPPLPREQTVVRERLVETLRPRAGVKLTVVAAPAGYGKTTLLGTWRDSESEVRPVAWLTLDGGDNDPVVLWLHVVEALRRARPELGESLPDVESTPPAVDGIAHQLVNELSEQDDVVLVLDDFHQLSLGPARDGIAWLIEHAPSTLRLVLGTRIEPSLPLAAMRARGELLELRAADLGFTADEADALLNGRLGLGLARADVDRLVEQVEGWPAGIYLAGLSLAIVQDRHGFVQSWRGMSRDVVDFLVDEVLEAHDPATQSLMLRSSVLDRLSGPLCDELLETEGSATLLTQLARTNLFLLPLDDVGEWYRFHHLFAQLLRVELEHREPGVAQVLHRRAAAWYRSCGSTGDAIRHAQAAGEYREAADAIEEVWLTIASTGGHTTVLAWLDGFPDEFGRADPALLLIRAWVSSLAGDREDAASAVALLEDLRWPDDRALPDDSGSLEASLATLRARFPWGDVESARAHALRAIELMPEDASLRSEAMWALAISDYCRGDLDAADRRFAETVQVGFRDERWLVTASALAYRSLIAGERRRVDEQRLLAEEASEVARERDVEEARGEVRVAVGVALEARGELEEALPHIDRGVAVLRSGQPLDFALALIHHARVLKAMGRRKAAAAAIGEAGVTIASCRDPGILGRLLHAVDHRPLQARRRERDLSERELSVLRMLTGPLSERDIGRELYLSHNTIHSHTKSIYRKLGVSSRKQAVQRALILGLLKDHLGESRGQLPSLT